MKKALFVLLLVSLVLTLCACQSTLRGEDALMEKAREELPLADAENIALSYAGSAEKDDLALLWFISGNEYQAHYYLPMECEIVGPEEYRFIHTYKPMDRGLDIAVVHWRGGYAFLVNNPNCTTIRITDNSGTQDIAVDQLPFLLHRNIIPSEYVFLDAEGNEIP